MDTSELIIQGGQLCQYFAFEVGLSIDLDGCYQLLNQKREFAKLKETKRGSKYFEWDPSPLRITQSSKPIVLHDNRELKIESVEITLFDFGVISVGYIIDLQGPFSDLIQLSHNIYETQPLFADARERVCQLLDEIRSRVQRAKLSTLVEEYLVFDISSFVQKTDIDSLLADHSYTITKILRCEPGKLAEDQVEDALWCRISYSPEDFVIIDWNAALIYGGESEDTRAVLEFGNVQLLETRFLDEELDDSLEEAYHALTYGKVIRTNLKRIGQLQVDSAYMFEESKNALKLLGDQYLARVYSLMAERFHLADWDESILRKLDSLDDIYTKMSDRAAQRRTEILEWVVVFLFIFEIVLSLMHR